MCPQAKAEPTKPSRRRSRRLSAKSDDGLLDDDFDELGDLDDAAIQRKHSRALSMMLDGDDDEGLGEIRRRQSRTLSLDCLRADDLPDTPKEANVGSKRRRSRRQSASQSDDGLLDDDLLDFDEGSDIEEADPTGAAEVSGAGENDESVTLNAEDDDLLDGTDNDDGVVAASTFPQRRRSRRLSNKDLKPIRFVHPTVSLYILGKAPIAHAHAHTQRERERLHLSFSPAYLDVCRH